VNLKIFFLEWQKKKERKKKVKDEKVLGLMIGPQ
jgi:hypothetical protein